MTLLVLSCCGSFYSGVQPAIFAEILVKVNGHVITCKLMEKDLRLRKIIEVRTLFFV